MQLLIKFGISFLTIMFFFSIVYAGELGVSPAKIEFSVNSSETHCQELKIFSSVKSNLELKDYWSETMSKNIEDYVNKSEDYGISLFVEDYNYESKGTINVCVRGRSKGTYYGVLLLSYPDRKVGIGVWMKVKVRDEGQSVLTLLKNIENTSLGWLILIESTFLNGVILALLFIYRKRAKIQEN